MTSKNLYSKKALIIGIIVLLIASSSQSCGYGNPNKKSMETNSDQIQKEKRTFENIRKYQPYQIHQDTTTLNNLLEGGGYLERMISWRGKALFVKFEAPQDFRYYYYNSLS